MHDELTEGIHRGNGHVSFEAELKERDRICPVIQGHVLLSHWFRDEGLRLSRSLLQVDQEFNCLLTADDDSIICEVQLLNNVTPGVNNLAKEVWLIRELGFSSHPLRGGSYSDREVALLPKDAFFIKVHKHLLVQTFKVSCCSDASLPASESVIVYRDLPILPIVDSLRSPELERGPENANDHGLQRF